MCGIHVSDIDLVLAKFREWGQARGIPIGASHIMVHYLGVPHRPVSLRVGWQGVYAFQLGATWLKVGKAGPKSNARWISHHYGPTRAISTLAGSLLRYTQASSLNLPSLPPDLRARLVTIHPEAIGNWIKQNTARVNICIREELRQSGLTALENIALGVLHPVFEGRWETNVL